MHKVLIDLLTRRSDGAYVVVLIEEGRWEPDAVASQMRKLQTRLQGAVDAVLGGFLASKYQQSKGGPVIIRLDCYDVPRQPVEEFLLRFSAGIKASAYVRDEIERSGFISCLDFEFNWRSL